MDLVFIAKSGDDNKKLDCSFLIVSITNHEETTWQVPKAGKEPTYSGSLRMDADGIILVLRWSLSQLGRVKRRSATKDARCVELLPLEERSTMLEILQRTNCFQ
jgi:hypothetical protein